MSNHSSNPQMFYNGVWNVLTPAVSPNAYALTSEKIKVTRGFADSDLSTRPASIRLRLHDPTDLYRPTNPTSPIYGAAGTNTTLAVTADGSTRAYARCSSFKPDQSEGFTLGPPIRGQKWIDIEAQGQLRQIGLWTTPLRSPIYRDISGIATLLGYWPLEDSEKATQLSNAAPNGQPGQAAGVTFRGADGADGSDKVVLVKLADASSMTGKFAAASSTAGWQTCFSLKIPTVASGTDRAMFTWAASNGYTWQILANSANYTVTVTDRSGTLLATNSTTYGVGAEPGQWIRFACKASVSAGTVTVSYSWYPQGGGLLYSSGMSFAGTVGALVRWSIVANANTDNGAYGHVVGVTGTADNFLGGYHFVSFNGYVGERAEDRFKRLCSEEGIFATYVGAIASTWIMGRQPPATFLELLKEVAATEDALIFDSRLAIGLTMRTRRDRYNQTSKLDLTFGVNVAVPLQEEIDDLDIHNVVTVSQRDGSDVTVADTTGPQGTQNPPSGVGEYKQTIDVNVGDEGDLGLLAGWWLKKGTIPGARYKQITVDLDAPTGAALTTAVNSVDIGDRITLSGRTPDKLGLLVIGIDEEIETMRRRVTFTTVPDDVWNPAVYGGATAKRYGITNCTTNASMTTTVGSLVAVVAADQFGTNLPYDLLVTGERMTVTAVGAVVGGTQTLTVTRSVNGVVKAHAAGEPVQLHPDQLARYGL
jgi:hypothetical protein